MSGKIKKQAQRAAERYVPSAAIGRVQRVDDIATGYMIGHNAHIRSANKRLQPFISKAIEELKVVEREIGVPSEALKLLRATDNG